MQWCSSCHPGMPGADIGTSFRWIETLAKVARLFAKACEISESQWSGNKGQCQYQKTKQERIKIIENPCKVATIYYHFENTMTVYGCYLNKHRWTAHLEEFIEVHSIISRQGLQQMDLQWAVVQAHHFWEGFHMEIHTWRFFFTSMSCCQKNPIRFHKSADVFLDQLNWWFWRILNWSSFISNTFFGPANVFDCWLPTQRAHTNTFALRPQSRLRGRSVSSPWMGW